MTPPATAAAPGLSVRSRRVSGGPRATRASAAVPLTAPGISDPRRRKAPQRRPVAAPSTRQGDALIERLMRLPDHRLLDRLIRGRVWIGIVAFALIGIVAMQLAILKLNTGIGHSLQRVAQLQRENPAMSIENSAAAAGENVEPQATARGMEMSSVGAIGFLTASPSDVRKAASVLRADAQSRPVAPPTQGTTEGATTSEAATSGETSLAPAQETITQAGQESTAESSVAPSSEATQSAAAATPEASASQQDTTSSSQASPATSAEPSEQAQSTAATGGGTEAGPQE